MEKAEAPGWFVGLWPVVGWGRRGGITDSINSLQSRMEWQGMKDFILSLKHSLPDFFSHCNAYKEVLFFTLQPSKHNTCNWNKTEHYLTILHVRHWYSRFSFFSIIFFLTFCSILGYSWLTNNAATVLGEQWRDSATHIHVSILPTNPSHSGCYITLSRVPCAIQEVLVGYAGYPAYTDVLLSILFHVWLLSTLVLIHLIAFMTH